MATSSFLNMDTTKECIYKIRDLNRKFRLSCSQLILINNLIDETEVRYNRSQEANRRSYRYVLRLKLCTLEGVRNQFYEYAYAAADKLEKMQLDLYNKTGIAWNDSLAQESEPEDYSDEEDDSMETDNENFWIHLFTSNNNGPFRTITSSLRKWKSKLIYNVFSFLKHPNSNAI